LVSELEISMATGMSMGTDCPTRTTPTRTATAANLKALAKQELGGILELEPNSVEPATAFQKIGEGLYPLFLLDWYPDFLDADNYIQPFFQCLQGSAATGCQSGSSQEQGSFYYSDRVNELIDRQRQELNPQARKEIFAELQEIIAREVPFIPLWQNKDFVFASQEVKGLVLSPTQNLPLWTLSK